MSASVKIEMVEPSGARVCVEVQGHENQYVVVVADEALKVAKAAQELVTGRTKGGAS